MDVVALSAAAFGSAFQEFLHWHGARRRLNQPAYRRLMKSTAYWMAVIGMVAGSAAHDLGTAFFLIARGGNSNLQAQTRFTDSQAPLVDAGPDLAISFSSAAVLSTAVTDDGVATDTATVTVNSNAANTAVRFGGTNAFVTFGAAPQLGAATFTLETWFRRDGAGSATSTGVGGVTAIPLVTKGMAETEGGVVDMNYFLGISATTNMLVADFEDTATGLNHPVSGTTAIPADSQWHHVAASYDGTTWRLYLDGALQTTLTVGAFTPRFNSIQHAALGTALDSTGSAGAQTQGFFNGAMDEVRIWNYARSAQQILSGQAREIPSASGLLGRWSFNEDTGTTVNDSSSSHVNGTITGTNWSWSSGGPFAGVPNAAPSADAGPDQIVTMPAVVMLEGSVTDDDVTGSPVVLTWTQASGPGTVAFVNPSAASTIATFSDNGSYVLTLTANDGELSGSDDVTIHVTALANQPPVADAGPDQSITLPVNVATLSGVATDDGVPGPLTMQWTEVSGPGAVTFTNGSAASTTATFSQHGVYVLQLSVHDGLLTTTDTATVTVNSNAANTAVRFGGTNAFVTFGAAPQLGAATFTLETWFRRDGAGSATSTGVGGVTAIPLVTKGMAETEGGVVDMNYFLGISATTNMLVADFEDTATGLNHPVSGTTAIPADSQWHHVAASYDGTTWRLYLDGALQATLTVGAFTPRFDSIQHAALGTALDSTGSAGAQTQGFFNGAMDEVRIWNYARSAQQIGHGRTLEIASSAPGLLARWGLNEGSGTVVGDSSGSAISGLIAGSNWSWVAGAPFSGAENAEPVATTDSATTAEDTGTTIAVLANDTDADGDALAITAVGAPGHGTASINPNGTVTYAPAAGFNGSDSFTYSISDGQGGSATATVNVTVTSANTAPTAVDDSYSTNEDTTLTVGAPGVHGNDTDVDGDALTAIVVSDPEHGTLTLNADGSFSYSPAANFTGSDSFRYKANDGIADSNVAAVTITVLGASNGVPVAVNNSYDVNEDATRTVAAPGVLRNDHDPDHDPLTAILVSGPTHGTLTLNANGSFSYTPDANVTGSDSFTYKANDGKADSNTATVTITVNAVNDAPVAADDSYSTSEDAVLTVVTPGVLANDTDIDSPTRTAVKVTNPAHGTVTLNANGSFTYMPRSNYNGPDSFTYKARDDSVGSNIATVSITVGPVADPPVAQSQSKTLNEDGARAIVLKATDADGDPVTSMIVALPAHGTLSGTVPDLTYTPDANYNGQDSFTFKATDGTLDSAIATVSLTINPVNDAPVAQDGSISTAIGTPVSGQLVASDVDDNSLTYTITSQPSKGVVTVDAATGAFIYTPSAGKTGTDSFRFKANDGKANSNAGRISVTIK